MFDALAKISPVNLGLNYKATKDAQKFQSRQQEANNAMQREFAQKGIQWRVEDAKQAGIHPLAALGASVTSYSPQSVGTPHMANFLSKTGQDISGAVARTANKTQRDLDSIAVKTAQTNLESSQLDNEIKQAQLIKMRTGNPAFPTSQGNMIAGQGDTPVKGGVRVLPKEAVSGVRGIESGENPATQYIQNVDGSRSLVKSEKATEALESDWLGQLEWLIQNRILPAFSGKQRPPYDAPKGQKWKRYWTGRYELQNK